MNSLFYVGDKYVRKDLAHNLMRLIAEGSGEDDEDADNELRASAVVAYMDILVVSKEQCAAVQPKNTLHRISLALDDVCLSCLLQDDMAPQILKQIACWVIGEYAYIAAEAEPLSTLEVLAKALEATQDDELQVH